MLYKKYSTVFAFDPPTQNSLYIYIYVVTYPLNFAQEWYLHTEILLGKGRGPWQIFFYKFITTLIEWLDNLLHIFRNFYKTSD